MELLFSISLLFFCLLPLLLVLNKRNIIFFPIIIYGLSIAVYLILATLLYPEYFRYSGSYYFTIIMACIPVYLITLFTMKYTSIEISKIKYSPESIKASKIIFMIIWIVSIIGISSYIIIYKNIPIVETLYYGSSAEIYEYRMNITYNNIFKDFELYFYFLPGLAAVLGHYLYRLQKIPLFVNIISLIGASIAGFFFLHKSFIVFIIIKIFIIDYFYKGFSIRKLLTTTAFILTATTLTYSFYMKGYTLQYKLEQIASRIFGSYAKSLEFVLNQFPENESFFYGRTFPNPKNIFNFDSIYLSQYIMKYHGGKSEGTIPVGVFGEMYSNFGFMGVCFSTLIIMGLFIVLINLFFSLYKSPTGLVVWLSFSFDLMNLSTQSIFVVVSLKSIFIYLVIILVTMFLENYYIKSPSKRRTLNVEL